MSGQTIDSGALLDSERREQLGRLVRETWVAWAKEQPTAKPSWLVPWEELQEPDKEVDRRIGEAVRADVLGKESNAANQAPSVAKVD